MKAGRDNETIRILSAKRAVCNVRGTGAELMPAAAVSFPAEQIVGRHHQTVGAAMSCR